jgi:protein TonB
MTFRAAIAISVVLHFVLLGVAYTVEVPEELEPDSMAFRHFASVEFTTVRPDEVDEDGSDDPMLGVPNPVEESEPQPEEQAEPEPEPESEPEPEPKAEPEPEPKAEPEPEPEMGAVSDEELKSVVADKREDSDSPVDTDAVADADAKAKASVAPGDSGDGSGTARADQVKKNGVGTSAPQIGPRGVRDGSGADQKRLNQKYGLILHRHISGAKSYPRFARKAGIEGRLLVEITVDSNGRILAVKVRESSGHQILDDTTIDTIRNFERFPLPPQGLTWTKKTFVLPVSYKLS